MKNRTLGRRSAGCVALSLLVLAGACSRNIQNDEAVRQAVIDYLQARKAQTGLDVSLMEVQVKAVSFQQNVARASITFVPKGSPDSSGMSMSYTLDRKANKWVVRPREAGAASPHDGADLTTPPEASGAVPAVTPEGMPPGHPAVGSAPDKGTPGELPPGHPPIGTKE